MPMPAITASRLNVPPADGKPWWQSYGQTLIDVPNFYSRQAGQTVSASFRAGHPKHEQKPKNHFYRLKTAYAGWGYCWVTVADDGDWETSFKWSKSDECWCCSTAEIIWRIPVGIESGNYRLQHKGNSKHIFGYITPYTGTSSTFKMR